MTVKHTDYSTISIEYVLQIKDTDLKWLDVKTYDSEAEALDRLAMRQSLKNGNVYRIIKIKTTKAVTTEVIAEHKPAEVAPDSMKRCTACAPFRCVLSGTGHDVHRDSRGTMWSYDRHGMPHTVHTPNASGGMTP